MQTYDVAIIGGGINGCGCAADAAMRGLTVFLCEKDDLASKTSSSSTKLIHGGLRYLEYLDFALVKKSLDERQKLLELAPHLVYPMPIVLLKQKNMRPNWLIRTGLFIYDHLSRKSSLPKTKTIRRHQKPNYFDPLTEELTTGFMFYDCSVDDARLTLANAKQAEAHGATIMPDTELVHAEANDSLWILSLKSKTGDLFQIKAKAIINATGPWVETVNQLLKIPLEHTLSLVKGSHLIVDKLYDGEHAYLLQHEDKRVVFVIPYHGYTMIGTTDIAFHEALSEINISTEEIDYLLGLVNKNFKKKLGTGDIVTSWSGVRPLLAEAGKAPTATSRDYAYQFSNTPAPSITIYGGKITTYRQLSLSVIDQLRPVFPNLADSNTAITPLPGATLSGIGLIEYQSYARAIYHWLDRHTLERYLTCYGTDTELLLAGCGDVADLGICFADTFYQVEVDYLLDEEWATNCDDILWRRTKLGLTIDDASQQALADYIAQRVKQCSRVTHRFSRATTP